MQTLLTQTWSLLQRNWILLWVVVGEAVVFALVQGGGANYNPIFLMALYFFHLAVLAGWLYQMKAVVLREEHSTSFDDFFEGVARYFLPLMGGGSMFVFLWMMALIFGLIFAQLLGGAPEGAMQEQMQPVMEQLTQLVQAGKAEEAQLLLDQHPAMLKMMTRWVFALLLVAAVVGLYCVTLCFWTHWAVLSDMRWMHAWRKSRETLWRHWRSLTVIGFVWLLPWSFARFLSIGGALAGNPVFALVGKALLLVVNTYFSLLFINYLIHIDRESITPLLDEVPPDQQTGGGQA